jgi:ubiquitin carboxyl-terminal hydrolase 6/32
MVFIFSIIVDLFYGQLKSKVTCLTCHFESVRFDPFSLLSLPLPVENYTYCEVLVSLLDGTMPTKYGLRLNSDCKYWDLKNHLSKMCHLEPERMLVCELYGSQMKCILPNEQKIKPNTAFELYVFEIPKLNDQRRKSTLGGEFGIEKGLKDIQRNQGNLNFIKFNYKLFHIREFFFFRSTTTHTKFKHIFSFIER